MTSVILIHHRSTAYESFTTGPRYVTLSRLVPCYKRDWATLLLLFLLPPLCCCCHYCCYLLLCCCCYYCSLLLCCYLLQDFVGANIPSTRLFLAPLIQQVRNSLPSTDLFFAPLLSYHFATDTLLADINLSGVVELKTQLLILENILSLPLVSNQ